MAAINTGKLKSLMIHRMKWKYHAKYHVTWKFPKVK